jgi:zinc protease
MSWPTEDDSDFDDTLKLELLQRVVQVELTDDLREKLGATYSPGVNASESRTWRGYGTFNIAAPVDAAQVEPTRQAMLAAIERLTTEPVDPDTLLRARQPLLESYDNALKTNVGWLALASDAQSEPDRLARFTAAKAKVAALTPADLQAIAAKYLKPEERLEIDVLPKELGSDESLRKRSLPTPPARDRASSGS